MPLFAGVSNKHKKKATLIMKGKCSGKRCLMEKMNDQRMANLSISRPNFKGFFSVQIMIKVLQMTLVTFSGLTKNIWANLVAFKKLAFNCG